MTYEELREYFRLHRMFAKLPIQIAGFDDTELEILDGETGHRFWTYDDNAAQYILYTEAGAEKFVPEYVAQV